MHLWTVYIVNSKEWIYMKALLPKTMYTYKYDHEAFFKYDRVVAVQRIRAKNLHQFVNLKHFLQDINLRFLTILVCI